MVRGMTVARLRGVGMKMRKVATGLAVFLLVTSVMTWLVHSTLEREVSGDTTEYSAEFTDVFGLRDGDDVRMAGAGRLCDEST